MTRTRITRAAMVVWIAGWLTLGLGSMLTDASAYPKPDDGGGKPKPTACWVDCHPTPKPSGAIGHPATGTNPKHTHKPPREPRITQPPTDTE